MVLLLAICCVALSSIAIVLAITKNTTDKTLKTGFDLGVQSALSVLRELPITNFQKNESVQDNALPEIEKDPITGEIWQSMTTTDAIGRIVRDQI